MKVFRISERSLARSIYRSFKQLTELLPVNIWTQPDEGDAGPVLVCMAPGDVETMTLIPVFLARPACFG